MLQLRRYYTHVQRLHSTKEAPTCPKARSKEDKASRGAIDDSASNGCDCTCTGDYFNIGVKHFSLTSGEDSIVS